MAEKNVQNDFSKGNIPAVVMRMALPLIAAQLVNVLYNVVDRIYIGHIPNVGSMALTGVGIALPVISILSAFAGLFGQGGAPLCSMARGRGDNGEASRVMGNAFSMLLVSSVALGLLTWAFLDPVITVFAAGKEASSYAREYLAVYLIGTTFSFVSLGMNVYINAQGFATRGMLTVLLGAAANIVLDPLFIFAFRMGVRGAAAATVLSQALSAAWCFLFLRSSKTPLELSWRTMAPRKKIMGRIMSLGVADFVMGATNSAIQTVANRQLGLYGGDLYVGAITVVNSLRTIFTEIIHGFGSGIQPVLAFNYGAGQKKRVLETIRFSTLGAAAFSLLVWAVYMLFPEPLIRIFTPDEALITGESLAQVASQTMAALACTDQAQDLPVLRPCIGMDKIEIINISRKIGTFETSIEPYEDCCTIFTPPHPKTNPMLDEILAAEAAMPELAALETEAAENVEKIYIRMGDDELL